MYRSPLRDIFEISVWNNGTTYRPWYENEESEDEFGDLFDSESEQELQEPDSDTESESPLPKRQPAPKPKSGSDTESEEMMWVILLVKTSCAMKIDVQNFLKLKSGPLT